MESPTGGVSGRLHHVEPLTVLIVQSRRVFAAGARNQNMHLIDMPQGT